MSKENQTDRTQLDSRIETFRYPDGRIQRVQLVKLPDWNELEFLLPEFSPDAFDSFCSFYRRYLVPGCPWVFGNIVLFRLPDGLELPGIIDRYDKLTAAATTLKNGLRIHGGKARCRTDLAERLWQALRENNCAQIVRGKLPITTIIPVSNAPGFLTRTQPDARVKVNGCFFIMDPFDCATVYDHVGACIGLRVKNGVVENPPQFSREALLVKKDGIVTVEQPELTYLTIRIGDHSYIHGQNATVYSRPQRAKTPNGKGTRLVIVGCRVVAVHHGGRVPIPASGFVLCPEGECHAQPGDKVIYAGMEDVAFGMQVGNSIVKDGVKTERFISRFYNIRKLEPIPFPPSLYPMDFEKGRAARIALGADKDGKPLLLWAEGAGKMGYVPGRDSCGASLADMAKICQKMGMVNAIHLDGGGSAQMLLRNCRSLKISDRSDANGTESERPVPMGLMVK